MVFGESPIKDLYRRLVWGPYRELLGRLPAGTEHADLVAQLGARMAIDGVDEDQRGEKVSRRTLSRNEWVQAAKQLTGIE